MLASKVSFGGGGGGGGGGSDRRTRSIKLRPRKSVKELLPRERDSMAERVAAWLMYSVLLAYTAVIWFGEALFLPEDEADWCMAARRGYPITKQYHNPDCNNNPCFRERPWQLLFVSPMECDFARRMIVAVFFGAAIGFERKASDRPAGIRTMSLVCLGACFFTMCSQIAFFSSTMGWDAARVSAAVPSGVGFLGSALIWKGSTGGAKGSPEERHEVHGLTMAASVWLSASIGVGVGGKLLVVSAYAVALVLLVLRLGPKLYFAADSSSFGEDMETESGSEWSSAGASLSSDRAPSDTTDDSDAGADGSENESTSNNGGGGGVQISAEEQMRLLMGLSVASYYGESERSLVAAASVSNLRRYRSAPNLNDFDEDGTDIDDAGERDGFTRANSAPMEDTTTHYEVPLKDHSDMPSSRRRKDRRRRRRRNRSHSPRRRRYHVGFLS